MNRYIISEFQSHTSKNMDYTQYITFLYEIIEFLILFHYNLNSVWPKKSGPKSLAQNNCRSVNDTGCDAHHRLNLFVLYIWRGCLHTFANGLGSSLADNKGFRSILSIQSIHKRMVQFKKLTRNLFLTFTLHGHNVHPQQRQLSKFLMRYQQFASHAYCEAAGPSWKLAPQ
jgi:hypothetical protein